MIENEIYCYVNDFLKWNISKKISYIIGNNFFAKICIRNLRNKREGIFARIFHNDIENIKSNLIKNAYLLFLIDKVIKKCLDYKFSSNQNQLKDKSDVHYFKLPYIGNISHHIKNKLLKLCKEFCKENFNIKLVFNSFKINNYFSYRDPIPNNLKSFLVYKFTCACGSSSYIGETCHHFRTMIEEHINKDNKSLIFKNLHSTVTYFDSYNTLCFKVIDKANSKFDLKIKEAVHINFRKPNLNAQQNHLALTFSL